MLANVAHVENVPGRKSHIQRLQKTLVASLLTLGLAVLSRYLPRPRSPAFVLI
jgi:hypothetical protein